MKIQSFLKRARVLSIAFFGILSSVNLVAQEEEVKPRKFDLEVLFGAGNTAYGDAEEDVIRFFSPTFASTIQGVYSFNKDFSLGFGVSSSSNVLQQGRDFVFSPVSGKFELNPTKGISAYKFQSTDLHLFARVKEGRGYIDLGVFGGWNWRYRYVTASNLDQPNLNDNNLGLLMNAGLHWPETISLKGIQLSFRYNFLPMFENAEPRMRGFTTKVSFEF